MPALFFEEFQKPLLVTLSVIAIAVLLVLFNIDSILNRCDTKHKAYIISRNRYTAISGQIAN